MSNSIVNEKGADLQAMPTITNYNKRVAAPIAQPPALQLDESFGGDSTNRSGRFSKRCSSALQSTKISKSPKLLIHSESTQITTQWRFEKLNELRNPKFTKFLLKHERNLLQN